VRIYPRSLPATRRRRSVEHSDSDADLGTNSLRRSPPRSCRHATDVNREATFTSEPSGELADDAPTMSRGPRRRVVLSECRTRRRRADVTPTTRRRHRVCRRVRCEWLAEVAADILPTRHRRQPRGHVQGGVICGARRRRADHAPRTSMPSCHQCVSDKARQTCRARVQRSQQDEAARLQHWEGACQPIRFPRIGNLMQSRL